MGRGGGFRGSRSSGGRSFGGRSRVSSSRSSRTTRVSSSPRTRYRPHGGLFMGGLFWGASRHNHSSDENNENNHFSSGNIRFAFLAFFLVLFIGVVSFLLISGAGFSPITGVKEPEPLIGQVESSDWYEDNLGWIWDEDLMLPGLVSFYQETGVQPYLLLVAYNEEYWIGDNIDIAKAEDYLNQYYDKHFTDENHFLLAYFASANDLKAEINGHFHYVSGYDADSIMNEEALHIFWGYLELYYRNLAYSLEEIVGNTFESTAESIVKHSVDIWDSVNIQSIVSLLGMVVGGCIALVLLLIFGAYLIGKRERHGKEISCAITVRSDIDKEIVAENNEENDIERNEGVKDDN